MSQATVTFQLGAESVTSVLDIALPGGTSLSGDVSGTFSDAHIVGDVNQIGDVTVTGLLTGIDTFHWQGNGFSIFFEDGGRADLHGKLKAAWGPWGTPTTGWTVGDRIAVAPTKKGIYASTEMVWTGSWASMVRPASSLDVTLLDGRVVKPEVVNLSQSIVFENLARGWHIHHSGGVFDVSDVKVLSSGTSNVLGNYSIHFHMTGEAARGSLLERVVVEDSKFRGFVPHASHGITHRGCVVYNQSNGEAFWWDEPTGKTHVVNNSNDTVWEHCLALSGASTKPAFALGAGARNRCNDSAAVDRTLGFFWPGTANQNVGGNVWDFHDNVAHNDGLGEGIRAWQNDSNDHHNTDMVVYNCAEVGLSIGAYNNRYRFERMVIQGCTIALLQAALGQIKHTDILTDGMLVIDSHKGTTGWVEFLRCTFTKVWYRADAGDLHSTMRYIDCGLTPAKFDLAYRSGIQPGVHPQSIIEIIEGGSVVHRWAAGVWS